MADTTARGHPRESALAMPDAVASVSGAKNAGLKEVLAKAVDLAVQRQIDTKRLKACR